MRVACIIVLAALLCIPLLAENAVCPAEGIIVTATDDHDSFVPNLAPSDFRAEVHGRTLPIISSGTHLVPARLVIMMDVSGSMRNRQRFELARAVAIDAAQFTRPSTQIALLTFAEQIKPLATFGASRLSILQALNSMTWDPKHSSFLSGQTALLDSIVAASKLLDPPHLGDAIYVISDGGDNHSHARKPAVEDLLLGKGIRLFFFFTYVTAPPTPEEQSGLQELWTLAQATGGLALTLKPHHTQIKSGAASTAPQGPDNSPAWPVYEQMENFYTLKVGGLATLTKPEKWKLQLHTAEGLDPKHIHLHYPAKLFPCAGSEIPAD